MTRLHPFRSMFTTKTPIRPRMIARRILFSLAVAGCSVITGATEAQEESAEAADGPWISSVAWQDDSSLLGTHSQGLLFRPAEVVQASAAAPTELKVVGESETSLWSVLPTKAGGILASDYKGGVHLFAAAADKPATAKPIELEARWIRALEQSPSADEVLAGTEDGKLVVLSVSQGKELKRVDAHAAAIFDIALSAAGDKVATAAGDGSIKIFSWPGLEPQGEMRVSKDAIWGLTFVNDDRQIVSGGSDRAIQLWDVASHSSIVTMATAHNWVTSVVALPKSNFVLAGCMDGSVVVVDLRRMLAVTEKEVAKSAIWSMALSPDGKQLAVGTRKHGLQVAKVQPLRRAARKATQQMESVRPPAPKKS
jgi:WD40 repeat protein